MRLLVLGDFAGRAIGHTALLAGLLEQLLGLDDIVVSVPSFRPRALRAQLPPHVSRRIQVPSLAPWRGAWGFSGPGVRRLVASSDRVALVDNQLHEVGFGRPLRNPLRALERLVATLDRHGIPLVYLNGGFGPLRRPAAIRLAASIARAMTSAALRDAQALAGFRILAPDVQAHLGADSGLSFRWLPAADPRGVAGNGARVAYALSPAAIAAGHGPSPTDPAAWLIADHPGHRRAVRRAAEAARVPASEVIEPGPGALGEIARRLPDTGVAVTDRYHLAVMFASAGIPSRIVGESSKALRFTESLKDPDEPAANFQDSVNRARQRSERAVARLVR